MKARRRPEADRGREVGSGCGRGRRARGRGPFGLMLRAAIAALLLTGAASAQPAPRTIAAEDLDRRVEGSAATYRDLVRRAVPALDGKGGAPRALAGDPSTMAKDAGILSLSGIAAEADGKRYLVLLADFGDADDAAQSYTVLAAFEAGADPRLVDAVEVGADRFTGFGTPAVLKLGAGDAVVVRSSHHNSNQSYVSTSIALLRNGRFALVDRISLLSDRTCAGEWNQTLSLAAKPEPGQAYASIAASVREERKPSRTCRGEKPLKPLSRTISVSYRWDPARQAYRPSSQAFEQLAREASDRM